MEDFKNKSTKCIFCNYRKDDRCVIVEELELLGMRHYFWIKDPTIELSCGSAALISFKQDENNLNMFNINFSSYNKILKEYTKLLYIKEDFIEEFKRVQGNLIFL